MIERYIQFRLIGEKKFSVDELADKVEKTTKAGLVDKLSWDEQKNEGSFRVKSHENIDFTEVYNIICNAGYAIIKDKTE